MTESTESNTQRAVSVLRDKIFSGELGPGSDHLETELAQLLGMSRTPVREAILVLAAQGLVQVRPRRGMRVSAVSPGDIGDVYDVLTELESLAAERAAQKHYSTADLEVLRNAIDDMDAALDANDREAWARADARFHRELLRLGGNARAERITRQMEDQVRRAKAVTLHLRPMPVQSNVDHRAVLEAIAVSDPGTARQRHHAHRRVARDMLVALLAHHKFPNL